MKKTKIDWCDSTINPVVGCQHGCKYCYARKINTRFHIIPCWEQPQFFPERLKQFESKMPKSVFIDSMSDTAFWKTEWAEQILEAIKDNPQHNYIVLSKKPSEYARVFPDTYKNIYFGATATNTANFVQPCAVGELAAYHTATHNKVFLSVEPLLDRFYGIALGNLKKWISAVIIGAETGNRKGKVIPQKEWVDDIVRQCDDVGIPVFMKESLRKIMGNDFRQDKLLWEIEE